MKRILASLAIGILIPVLVVVAIIIIKIIYPGTTTGISLLWFFLWPAFWLRFVFPSLTSDQLALVAFPVGLFIDIAVLSLIAYLGMRTIRRAISS